MLSRSPQYIQVPAPIGELTDALVPRAVVLPRPNQHLQVPAGRGEFATVFATVPLLRIDVLVEPRAPVFQRPHQNSPGARPQRRFV